MDSACGAVVLSASDLVRAWWQGRPGWLQAAPVCGPAWEGQSARTSGCAASIRTCSRKEVGSARAAPLCRPCPNARRRLQTRFPTRPPIPAMVVEVKPCGRSSLETWRCGAGTLSQLLHAAPSRLRAALRGGGRRCRVPASACRLPWCDPQHVMQRLPHILVMRAHTPHSRPDARCERDAGPGGRTENVL